jgi:transketolase
MDNIPQKEVTSQNIRRIILEQSMHAHVGHIGSALSIADIIAVLYKSVLRIANPGDPDRDRFILSKGHAALALYAALFLKGWITEDDLNSYCTDGSLLGVHPDHAINGIDFCSGSLGHGLPIGAGAALAAKMQQSKRCIFVLISDAECNEGSLWEAVMFAAHHHLSNLIAIVDMNGQQALDYTNNVMDLSPLAERWKAFGWDVVNLDGHNIIEMEAVIKYLNTLEGPPHAIIARTVFGKGVSFMENQIKWHYWPMSEKDYCQATLEINMK